MGQREREVLHPLLPGKASAPRARKRMAKEALVGRGRFSRCAGVAGCWGQGITIRYCA